MTISHKNNKSENKLTKKTQTLLIPLHYGLQTQKTKQTKKPICYKIFGHGIFFY